MRQYLGLGQGHPSHDTIGRVVAAIDPDEFGVALVRWVEQMLPAPVNGETTTGSWLECMRSPCRQLERRGDAD